MVVLVGAALACLLLGFVLGTRAHQMLAAARMLAQKLAEALARASGEDAGAKDDGADAGDDAVEADEGDDELIDLAIDSLFSFEPSLDLHPELELNPVILHQIKIAKEEERRERTVKALQLEGVAEDEIEARLASGDTAGGGGAGKICALQVLVDNGARVTSAAAGKNAEQATLDHLRRQRRNVETFLSKQLGVEAGSAKLDARHKRAESAGQHVTTAAEKAAETKVNPYGGPQLQRAMLQVGMASQARVQLAGWQTKLVREGKLRPPEAYEQESGQRRNGVEPDAADGIRSELGAEISSLIGEGHGDEDEGLWEEGEEDGDGDEDEEELQA
jgi:hypothetical protein